MTHATMNKTAVTGMSDYDEGYDVGHDGRAAGRAEVAVVLLDLIAELRAHHQGGAA